MSWEFPCFLGEESGWRLMGHAKESSCPSQKVLKGWGYGWRQPDRSVGGRLRMGGVVLSHGGEGRVNLNLELAEQLAMGKGSGGTVF